MLVLVGSTNPVKIKATKEAFEKFFENVEVKGIEVDSGVPPQPFDEETFQGALNRALNLKRKFEADFYVGIEGGVSKIFGRWFSFGAVCIVDRDGIYGFGTSPLFELPQWVVEELKGGKELGEVMDELEGRKGIKRREGAIGVFTKGVMKRKDLYVPGIITALIPHLNRELFREKNLKRE